MQDIANKRPMLWTDFETGGVEDYHSPLSFAMIATIGDRTYGEWYTEIRQTPLVIEPEALKINKIDILKEGLNFEQFKKEYFTRINKWFYGGSNFTSSGVFPKTKPDKNNMPLFCGHNTFFDRPILHRILGSTYDGAYYHRIDTMVLANALKDVGIIGQTENLKLETLANYFGVKPEGELHNALTDVKVTFQVYRKMKELLSKSVINTLVKDALNESEKHIPASYS